MFGWQRTAGKVAVSRLEIKVLFCNKGKSSLRGKENPLAMKLCDFRQHICLLILIQFDFNFFYSANADGKNS